MRTFESLNSPFERLNNEENNEGKKFKTVKKKPVKHHKRTLKRNEEVRLKYQYLIKDNPSKSQEAIRTLAKEYNRAYSTIRDIIYK